jgi:hypothetical protein
VLKRFLLDCIEPGAQPNFSNRMFVGGSHVQFPITSQPSLLDFCSFSNGLSALATASGRFPSCSAKSRRLTTTSPDG